MSLQTVENLKYSKMKKDENNAAGANDPGKKRFRQK